MNANKVNKRLLNKVISQVKKLQKMEKIGHNKRWRQSSWRAFDPTITPLESDNRCQTTMCIAGWAVELDEDSQWIWDAKSLAKWHREYPNHGDPEGVEYVKATKEEIKVGVAGKVPGPKGKMVYGVFARQRAMDLLGLNEAESCELFNGANSLPRVESIVAEIKAGAYR